MTIFVATMTGVAQMCADAIAEALTRTGVTTQVRLMDGLDANVFGGLEKFVIVSSTYGQGDIPDNGQAFFDAVQAGGDLTGKTFAVFGLGDRTFAATFCQAGEKWDALFAAKGAKRFAPLERHDASSGTLAEDEAENWALTWASIAEVAA